MNCPQNNFFLRQVLRRDKDSRYPKTLTDNPFGKKTLTDNP